MKNAILIAACLVAVTPSLVAAQTAPKTAEQVKKDVEQTQAIKTKIDEAAQNNPRFVRTLTNVQIELTLTDQIGTNPAEKKTVSMIASSGSWGKIRSAGTIRPDGDQLRLLAASLADGKLRVGVGASYPLRGATEALARATEGDGGAVVLEL